MADLASSASSILRRWQQMGVDAEGEAGVGVAAVVGSGSNGLAGVDEDRRVEVAEGEHAVGAGGLDERSSLATNSYFRYDTPMAVSKVSLSIDEDVLSEARDRAGRRELSSYVNDALRRQLQRDRLAELLTEMDAKSGPVPDDVMEQARQPWRSAPASKRRRTA